MALDEGLSGDSRKLNVFCLWNLSHVSITHKNDIHIILIFTYNFNICVIYIKSKSVIHPCISRTALKSSF